MPALIELQEQLRLALAELEELEKRIPAHSIRPNQLLELEEAENKVEELKIQIADLKEMG